MEIIFTKEIEDKIDATISRVNYSINEERKNKENFDIEIKRLKNQISRLNKRITSQEKSITQYTLDFDKKYNEMILLYVSHLDYHKLKKQIKELEKDLNGNKLHPTA